MPAGRGFPLAEAACYWPAEPAEFGRGMLCPAVVEPPQWMEFSPDFQRSSSATHTRLGTFDNTPSPNIIGTEIESSIKLDEKYQIHLYHFQKPK